MRPWLSHHVSLGHDRPMRRRIFNQSRGETWMQLRYVCPCIWTHSFFLKKGNPDSFFATSNLWREVNSFQSGVSQTTVHAHDWTGNVSRLHSPPELCHVFTQNSIGLALQFLGFPIDPATSNSLMWSSHAKYWHNLHEVFLYRWTDSLCYWATTCSVTLS